ncbi:hypothetical protein JVT61DRAFT_13649 [Boletus reticuloceps]|uniref:Uncharacterized protein n=1 Tax=Boletus reticuloceps TaxID=495285 RepID=A0A8I3A2W1_9AGAM|nr:hypothetical protein JVT61DRAFT_13649 [Boletus reticuloceps]
MLLSSPEPGQPPTKIQVKSVIQMALTNQAEGRSEGLMKWFTKGSPEDSQASSKKVNTMIGESLKDYECMHKMETEHCRHKRCEKNKARQQRHRQRVYAAEIASGIRLSRGSKCRQLHSSMSLEDMSSMSNPAVAELLHPITSQISPSPTLANSR